MLWWTFQQLKSKDAATRLAAVQKLSDDVTSRVGAELIRALGDSEETVRNAAAKAVGSTRDEQVLQPLLNALRDSNERMREGAAAALRQLGFSEAIPELVPLLGDANYAVRWQSARALESLGWSPEDNVAGARFAVARGRIADAAAFGADAVEALGLVLQSGAYHQRREAVEALSRIADARVVRALLVALKDTDDQVRSAAAEALCRIADPTSASALVVALKDAHKQVRATAARGLGQFGAPNVVEPLLSAARDPQWEVREAVCTALGRLLDPRGLDPLVQALNDPDREVREASVRALSQLNDKRAIGPLIRALVDSQDTVRQLALAAVSSLDMHWEGSEVARAAMPQLQEAMKSSEYWVRQAAADTLARIGRMKSVESAGAAATPASAAIAPSLDEPAHLRKQTTVDALVGLLADFDHELRFAAAETLGCIGQSSAIAPLTRSLKDAHLAVRKAAAQAIETLRGKPTPETNLILRGEDFPL